MIYGYEQPVQYTPAQVFNPVTANMVLQSMGQYADVALREYERALQDEKEFFKEYGNFSSPVSGATEEYYKLGVGRVKDAIASAQAQGIDLTRSQEGRAILRNIINSADVGRMNLLKQQKENFEMFRKSANEAIQKGEATPEFIESLLKQQELDNFLAVDNNDVRPWNLTAVPKYENKGEFEDRIFNDIKNTFLDAESSDGVYDYTGVGTKLLQAALNINLPSYLNSPSGRYEFSKFLSSLPEGGANLTDEQKIQSFYNNIIDDARDRYSHSTRDLNAIWEMNKHQENQKELIDRRGGDNDSNNNNDSNSNNEVVQGYSTQTRLFNEGVANLMQIPVTVVENVLKTDNNALYTIAKTQQAVIDKYTDEKGIVNASKALDSLSMKKSIDLVAKILGLKQVDDADKQSSVYTLPKEELKNIIDYQHLSTRLLSWNKKIANSSASKRTKNLRSKYEKYGRNEIKAVPTGHILTYLSVDGSIKQYAKVHLIAAKHDASGNPIDKVDDYTYIDLGTISTQVKNKDKEGKRPPIAIDRNLSTHRDYGFETVDKEVSSDKTESIKSAYNN